MPKPRSKPWPPDPNQTASGKPGAIHKPPKLALTAVMRKLILLANALLRDGRTWQQKRA